MKVLSVIKKLPIAQGSDLLTEAQQCAALSETPNARCIRWGLVGRTADLAAIEIASIISNTSLLQRPALGSTGAFDVIADTVHVNSPIRLRVLIIVPTGVGASCGGYIGDASPIVRVVEHIADDVMIHPNVGNAADFYGGGNSWYIDGYSLDEFLLGRVRLAKGKNLHIGVILDQLDLAQERKLVNAINAMKTIYGADIVGYSVCKDKVKARINHCEYGSFLGAIENLEIIIEAALQLANAGADAIALVTSVDGITESDWSAHYAGKAVNPVGAIEALMSRSVTYFTGLPCAHAPALGEMNFDSGVIVDPRASGEVCSGTGLPSVILGLMHAARCSSSGIGVNDLSCIIVPYNCVGGVPSIASNRFGAKLVAVRSNKCQVGVGVDDLRLKNVIAVENYAEAIAYVAALRANTAWNSLIGPVSPVMIVK